MRDEWTATLAHLLKSGWHIEVRARLQYRFAGTDLGDPFTGQAHSEICPHTFIKTSFQGSFCLYLLYKIKSETSWNSTFRWIKQNGEERGEVNGVVEAAWEAIRWGWQKQAPGSGRLPLSTIDNSQSSARGLPIALPPLFAIDNAVQITGDDQSVLNQYEITFSLHPPLTMSFECEFLQL